MVYCQAIFPRGAGLGTRLFPWARCVIFSHVNNVPMLAPQWVQPRVGPFLRGGIDRRAYLRQILLIGLFKTSPRVIYGFKKLWLQSTACIEPEPEQISSIFTNHSPSKDKILTFAGDRGKFKILYGWDQFLHKELRAITKDTWLQLADKMENIPIGINVRLGNDFSTARSPEDFYTRGGIKSPISWFIESLKIIRQHVGFPAQAVVVSDGRRGALKDLLDLENVIFIRPGCAISDLLLLARSKVLIASGASSFSAWASFLGQMPTISHPGQPLQWFELDNRRGFYVGEFDPGSPNQVFLQQVNLVLRDTISSFSK